MRDARMTARTTSRKDVSYEDAAKGAVASSRPLRLRCLVMALLFAAGRKNQRTADRFRVTLPVRVEADGRVIAGQTVDISENGLAVVLPEPVFLPEEEPDRKSVV